MPRFTQSQLRWSEQTQTYVVFIDDQARAQMHDLYPSPNSNWTDH
jgi:hypothetical protein